MFACLSVRNYAIYFWGQVISIAGTWMQNTALSWLILQNTHSGTAVGIAFAARYGPILLFGPYGGLLADRFNGRRMLFWAQLGAATLSSGLAAVVLLHVDTLGVLYALSLGLGLVNIIQNPVQQTFVNELVPRRLLANAIAINSISGNVSRAIGPLASGVVISGIGTAWCFVIDAVSFLVVMVTLVMIRPGDLYPVEPTPRAQGQLREGFRYMWRSPVVLLSITMVAFIGAFAWEFQVTLPLMSQQTFHGGSALYGELLGATGIGATGAALWIAYQRVTTVRLTATSAVLLGISMVFAAFAPNAWSEFLFLGVVGWHTIAFHVRVKSVLQLSSLPSMRGRVMAVWAVAWNGTTPIGGPTVGWVGQEFGPRWSIIAGAVPAMLIGAGALRFALRHPEIEDALRVHAPDPAVADETGAVVEPVPADAQTPSNPATSPRLARPRSRISSSWAAASSMITRAQARNLSSTSEPEIVRGGKSRRWLKH